MNTYLAVLKKYAVFGGRASRSEYWIFWLISAVIGWGLAFIDWAVFGMVYGKDLGVLGFIYGLAIFLPGLGVLFRRLHDTGHSAWWLLLVFIPLIGAVVIFIFLVTDSEPGENKYGPNPKGPVALAAS